MNNKPRRLNDRLDHIRSTVPGKVVEICHIVLPIFSEVWNRKTAAHGKSRLPGVNDACIFLVVSSIIIGAEN
ncbi:MAG: hypothetical protein V1782_12255 [Pseudomonadota bacterium]